LRAEGDTGSHSEKRDREATQTSPTKNNNRMYGGRFVGKKEEAKGSKIFLFKKSHECLQRCRGGQKKISENPGEKEPFGILENVTTAETIGRRGIEKSSGTGAFPNCRTASPPKGFGKNREGKYDGSTCQKSGGSVKNTFVAGEIGQALPGK